MFNNLVESASHEADIKRRGRFILGTLVTYVVLFFSVGVAGVLAYHAQVDKQDYELLTLLAPVTPPESLPAPSRSAQSSANNSRTPERAVPIAPIANSTKPPETVSALAPMNRELPPGAYKITGRDIDVGPVESNRGNGGRASGPGDRAQIRVDIDDAPPPVRPAPTPKRSPTILSKGVITGDAISLPQPAYPQIAIAAHVTGTVTVQILIDEQGRVISAHAISGPALLQAAAVGAAYRARFRPTLLSMEPVKVSGLITYNFLR